MQQWYQNLTKAQKILLYTASVVLCFAGGIGFVPLVFLLYLNFGAPKYKK